jgi:hypothetical protein
VPELARAPLCAGTLRELLHARSSAELQQLRGQRVRGLRLSRDRSSGAARRRGDEQGFGGGDANSLALRAGEIRGESLPATRQVRKRQHVTCAGQNTATSASNSALPYFRYVGICDSEFESASTPCRVRAQKCQRSRESGIPTTNAENAFFKIKAHPVTKDATRVGNFRRRTRALLLSALH